MNRATDYSLFQPCLFALPWNQIPPSTCPFVTCDPHTPYPIHSWSVSNLSPIWGAFPSWASHSKLCQFLKTTVSHEAFFMNAIPIPFQRCPSCLLNQTLYISSMFMPSDHCSKGGWLSWSQYRTHPDTKFPGQMRFITLEGQAEGGAGVGRWGLVEGWGVTKANSKHQADGFISFVVLFCFQE